MKYYQQAYEFDSTYPGIESRMLEISGYLGIGTKVNKMIAKNASESESRDTIVVNMDAIDKSISISELYQEALGYYKEKDYYHCLKSTLPILIARTNYKKSLIMSKKCLVELIKSQNLFSIKSKPKLHYGSDHMFIRYLFDASILRKDLQILRLFSIFTFYHAGDYNKFNNLFNNYYKKIKDAKILAVLLFLAGKKSLMERNYYVAAGRFFASNKLTPNFTAYKEFAYAYMVYYKTYFILSIVIIVIALVILWIAVQIFMSIYNKNFVTFEKACAAYNNGSYDKSLSYLSKIGKSKTFNSLSVYIKYLEGMIHVQKKDLKKAMTVFQQCKKEEFFIEPYINLAVLHGLVGDKDRVLTELRMCLQQIAEAFFRRKQVVEIGIMDYHRIVSEESDPHIELLFSTITKMMRY
ncbi:hypothetical protein KAJ27_20270 [bacterium]|nr:hypothetical protein [bacterium]